MRVRMLVSRVGVDVTYNAGSEYDLPDDRAGRWIDGVFAVPADGEIAVIDPVAEVAEVAPVHELAIAAPVIETAAKRGRPRK